MRNLYKLGLWETPNCLKIQGFAIGYIDYSGLVTVLL